MPLLPRFEDVGRRALGTVKML